MAVKRSPITACLGAPAKFGVLFIALTLASQSLQAAPRANEMPTQPSAKERIQCALAAEDIFGQDIKPAYSVPAKLKSIYDEAVENYETDPKLIFKSLSLEDLERPERLRTNLFALADKLKVSHFQLQQMINHMIETGAFGGTMHVDLAKISYGIGSIKRARKTLEGYYAQWSKDWGSADDPDGLNKRSANMVHSLIHRSVWIRDKWPKETVESFNELQTLLKDPRFKILASVLYRATMRPTIDSILNAAPKREVNAFALGAMTSFTGLAAGMTMAFFPHLHHLWSLSHYEAIGTGVGSVVAWLTGTSYSHDLKDWYETRLENRENKSLTSSVALIKEQPLAEQNELKLPELKPFKFTEPPQDLLNTLRAQLYYEVTPEKFLTATTPVGFAAVADAVRPTARVAVRTIDQLLRRAEQMKSEIQDIHYRAQSETVPSDYLEKRLLAVDEDGRAIINELADNMGEAFEVLERQIEWLNKASVDAGKLKDGERVQTEIQTEKVDLELRLSTRLETAVQALAQLRANLFELKRASIPK